jgi:8-oxo-dGTP diphosphatase
MRSWLVAGGLIEGPDGVLLVQNRRRNGRLDWSPPGGVIDPGEGVLDGLTREVLEETGLAVSAWQGPVYEIRAEAPGLGWSLRVEVYRALAFAGDLCSGEDPDGIVVDACYVPPEHCGSRLAGAQRWVVEPLTAWLADRGSGPRRFSYVVEGDDPASLRVFRR